MSAMTDRQCLTLSVAGALLLLAACVGAIGMIAHGVGNDVAAMRTPATAIAMPARTLTGIVGAVRY